MDRSLIQSANWLFAHSSLRIGLVADWNSLCIHSILSQFAFWHSLNSKLLRIEFSFIKLWQMKCGSQLNWSVSLFFELIGFLLVFSLLLLILVFWVGLLWLIASQSLLADQSSTTEQIKLTSKLKWNGCWNWNQLNEMNN